MWEWMRKSAVTTGREVSREEFYAKLRAHDGERVLRGVVELAWGKHVTPKPEHRRFLAELAAYAFAYGESQPAATTTDTDVEQLIQDVMALPRNESPRLIYDAKTLLDKLNQREYHEVKQLVPSRAKARTIMADALLVRGVRQQHARFDYDVRGWSRQLAVIDYLDKELPAVQLQAAVQRRLGLTPTEFWRSALVMFGIALETHGVVTRKVLFTDPKFGHALGLSVETMKLAAQRLAITKPRLRAYIKERRDFHYFPLPDDCAAFDLEEDGYGPWILPSPGLVWTAVEWQLRAACEDALGDSRDEFGQAIEAYLEGAVRLLGHDIERLPSSTKGQRPDFVLRSSDAVLAIEVKASLVTGKNTRDFYSGLDVAALLKHVYKAWQQCCAFLDTELPSPRHAALIVVDDWVGLEGALFRSALSNAGTPLYPCYVMSASELEHALAVMSVDDLLTLIHRAWRHNPKLPLGDYAYEHAREFVRDADMSGLWTDEVSQLWRDLAGLPPKAQWPVP